MNKVLYNIGFWSGILAFSATIAYCIVQLLQLYGVIIYPTDEILIYSSSLCIVIPFLILILALHYTTPDHKNSGAILH